MGNEHEHSGVSLGEDHQKMWDQILAELEPLVEGGGLSQAIERLSAALKMMGEGEETAALRARVVSRRGECLLDVDEPQAAYEDAQQALALGLKGVDIYALAGWSCYALEKPTRAREYFDQALVDAPDDVSLLTGRALSFIDLEHFDQARADLSHALRLDEENAELLSMRGEVHLRLRDLEGATKDLKKAVALAPSEPDYCLALARLYLAKGKIDQALAVVDGALVEDEEIALEAHLLRSHLHLLSGQVGAARADAIRASNLFPDEAFAFVQLAHVQLTQGKLALAKTAAERAVLLDPSLPDAYMVRGAARQMDGDADGAKRDFKRASRAPVELPVFLLGPAHHLTEGAGMGLDASLLELLAQQGGAGGFDPGTFDPADFAKAFGQGAMPGAGAIPGGMNPLKMLEKVFDDSGNLRGPFKPIFEMAFKNAPKIMENLPPGMLGDLDQEQLDKLDLSNLSSEEIQERMREFYQMMKSGAGPFDDDGEDPET